MTWVTRHVWTDQTSKAALLLRSHGLSNVRIGEKLGFHRETVARHIGMGRTSRAERIPEIIALKSKGLAFKEAAHQLGLTYWQVRAAYRLVPKELRVEYEQTRRQRYVEFNK